LSRLPPEVQPFRACKHQLARSIQRDARHRDALAQDALLARRRRKLVRQAALDVRPDQPPPHRIPDRRFAAAIVVVCDDLQRAGHSGSLLPLPQQPSWYNGFAGRSRRGVHSGSVRALLDLMVNPMASLAETNPYLRDPELRRRWLEE